MNNRIPTVLIDYAMYKDTSRLIGTGEITLPNLTAQTSEVAGAGIGGTVEMPILGHFDSMTVGIQFRTIEKAAMELMKPEAQDLVFRGSQQAYDGAGGAIATEPIVAYCRVFPKGDQIGTLNPGNSVDNQVEMECLRIRLVKDGEELCEIDKMNGIYRILGTDYSASVRADLGI